MVLRNYSLLKGKIFKDLEDSVRRRGTHHNLLVNVDDLEYQVNIDVQSSSIANVQVFFIEDFNNKILECLRQLGDTKEGLFTLDKLSKDYRLDYLRENLLDPHLIENKAPQPWQEISNLLDQHINIGDEIYCLGEYYNDNQTIEYHMPHGLMLRRSYGYLPPRGIHDIHMNQGTCLTMSQSRSNGIYQDGAFLVKNNSDNTVKGFFFVFTSQWPETDHSGNPIKHCRYCP